MHAETEQPVWHLYMLWTGRGALYTGISTDVARRFRQHVSGRGARSLRGKGPLTLAYQEVVGSQGEALRLEARIKKLSPSAKRAWLAERLNDQALSPGREAETGHDAGR
ncbi:GIY-YIG nuclease family protein [Larsenimonas rhizosphaerae]|uniref:GIY-YIG nuclease family protein n=1 Tax=Larsenimonas rhizosphaerae TaxID=2944682 RepID=A0AA42CUB1_9GAMM|nr:GIY-YIG nuclease family protein [Larsenimonas rhizosphaerae]MCX2523851.1 GIY-YIG nuclease family protein [Larsenimonas rhizosphaerae]